MTGEEIKINIEQLRKNIEDSQAKIRELQNICQHRNTFIGNYSWRIGVTQEAIMCSDCGMLIQYK